MNFKLLIQIIRSEGSLSQHIKLKHPAHYNQIIASASTLKSLESANFKNEFSDIGIKSEPSSNSKSNDFIVRNEFANQKQY